MKSAKKINNGLIITGILPTLLLGAAGHAVAQEYQMKMIVSGLEKAETSIYGFESHTFTNCGKSGYSGPTLAQCRTTYNTAWDEDDGLFSMSQQGIQEWTVPETGDYRITAAGAKGGSGRYSSGSGAKVQADVTLTAGEVIFILVGQRGDSINNGGGGGGGSFAVRGSVGSPVPLVIAGGGGGGGEDVYDGNLAHGATGQSGHDGYLTGGAGGKNGQGGRAGTSSQPGAGGAGLLGSGYSVPDAAGGQAFTIGGLGGDRKAGSSGGFGGGGQAGRQSPGGGGGGGYSGGGGGTDSGGDGNGGGGGSYATGTNIIKTAGYRSGHGYVSIERLAPL
jgi:hypothetical protein